MRGDALRGVRRLGQEQRGDGGGRHDGAGTEEAPVGAGEQRRRLGRSSRPGHLGLHREDRHDCLLYTSRCV